MGDDGYILGTEERRRLELLEELLDPYTTRSLDAIGVEAGWRCLEVGAGGGSVTRLLCDRVGPTGRVAAVDLDTRFVEELGNDNLDVYRRDIVVDGLPGDAYDLIHARLLLMHLPTREKILEEMAATLRPGGWLLIDDVDTYPLPAVAEGLYLRVWEAMIKGFDMANVSSTLGRQLPGMFDRAGLEAVEPEVTVLTGRGGTVLAQALVSTMNQLRPLLLAQGMTEAELEEFGHLTSDPTQWFSGFAFYSVRGRAPGG